MAGGGGWDLIVRAFFSDSGLSAGLAKMNAGLDQVRKTGPGARAGLRAVEIGARQLAFEAAGLSGGMGQLARGFLLFGGGSALMLGAAAGIGALALAYRHFTKDTREATEAQAKYREELARSAAARAEALIPQTAQIGADVSGARGEMGALNVARAARLRALSQEFLVGGGRAQAATLAEFIRGDEELLKIDEERARLSLILAQNRRAAVPAAKQEADELQRAAEAAQALRLEAIQFLQVQNQITVSEGLGVHAFAALRPAGFRAPAFGAGGLGMGGTPLSFANIRGNVPRFVPDPFPKKAGMDSREIAQMAMMSLMMGARGGAAGALAAGGGLLSGLSAVKGIGAAAAGPLGWAGFALSSLSNVADLFTSNADKNTDRLIQAIDRQGQEVAKQIRVIVWDPRTNTMHELREADEHDAVIRVPGFAGETG